LEKERTKQKTRGKISVSLNEKKKKEKRAVPGPGAPFPVLPAAAGATPHTLSNSKDTIPSIGASQPLFLSHSLSASIDTGN